MKLSPISSKKGGIASTITMFVATVVIFLILVAFALLSGIIKLFSKNFNDEKVAAVQGADLGLGDIRNYMIEFDLGVKEKYNLNKDKSVSQLEKEGLK
jgi:hypothetical protein